MLEVECGDLRDVLPTLEADSLDSCVCDPPYELGFMGKKWDSTGVAFDPATWAHVYRVLKPGAYLLAFGGTRTWHRIAVAIEDAGFEIRDNLAWLYGQGFPKSLDLSKAIDKAAGATREVIGQQRLQGNAGVSTKDKGGTFSVATGLTADVMIDLTAPATELAKQWEGWGTALKPSFEPVILARKPPIGTIAQNVEAHGVGGLHIDACRDGGTWTTWQVQDGKPMPANTGGNIASPPAGFVSEQHPGGRWPPNVICDESVAADLDAANAPTKSRKGKPRASAAPGEGYGMTHTGAEYNDQGGVSRYFYCPKANSRERDAGLEAAGWPALSGAQATDSQEGQARLHSPRTGAGRGGGRRNPHPTVKPLELMRWLVRLVTPPGGFVLDPFTGSGSTGCACALEGFHFAGVELDPTHTRLAMDRIAYWAKQAAA
jgi:hypothetical protein